MSKLTFFVVRMWALPSECSDPEKPHYVARVEPGKLEDTVQWTVTREFKEAHYFKKLRPAVGVVRSVVRIADRVTRGWLYEIIQIEEVIVASNVPEEEKEPKKTRFCLYIFCSLNAKSGKGELPILE